MWRSRYFGGGVGKDLVILRGQGRREAGHVDLRERLWSFDRYRGLFLEASLCRSMSRLVS